jgi:hypothetical protein
VAGDWIKVEHTTPDKQEVFTIADKLGIDPDAVVGKLVRMWVWADQQTYDGNAASVTSALLDRIAGVTGFADALIDSGWCSKINNGFVFTNFDRHTGKTAKTRANTAKRVSNHRNAPSVTSALPEKRREEKSLIRDVDSNKRKSSSYSAEFEYFWKDYPPHPGSKAKAHQRYKEQLRILASAGMDKETAREKLRMAAESYARFLDRHTDPPKTKYAEGWLNSQCYEIDYDSMTADSKQRKEIF